MGHQFLWVIGAILSLAACNPTTSDTEENSMQWIGKMLTENLKPTSSEYQDIHVLQVEACRLILAYSFPELSGNSMLQEIIIPTDDTLVRDNGTFLYSERVLSNCSPVGESELLIRRTAEEFKIVTSEISASEWTQIFQTLNEQCITTDSQSD